MFLASPGDLQGERRIARVVVDEFNKLWADELGYHVELVGWEDTVSVWGRPQATINKDLARCEFFIGMMWKRWGTPPSTDGPYTSGFQEEFEIAVGSRRDTGKPEISLLFKEVDSEALRDPGDELKKVLEFKRKIIAEKEILFESFNEAEFEKKIRACVTTYIKRLRSEEAGIASEKTQVARPAGDATPIVPATEPTSPEAPPQRPLFDEGSQFLHQFVGKTDNVPANLSAVEIARFRLLGTVVSDSGNDDASLGVHDANILFIARASLLLSYGEKIGLIDSALNAYSSENYPLWHWYAETNGFDRKLLSAAELLKVIDERGAVVHEEPLLRH
ncbi:MAG TPA: hypothetical protein VFB45_23895 [Pseudolabrys sp.]|nr:hypothetical protein [Pseudolabrys sp.]